MLNQVNVEPIQLDHDNQSTDPAAAHAGTHELHENNALGRHLARNMTCCTVAAADSWVTQNFQSIRRYLSLLTFTEFSSQLRKKNELIKPAEEIAHQTINLSVSYSCSWICTGMASPDTRVLCQLVWLQQQS